MLNDSQSTATIYSEVQFLKRESLIPYQFFMTLSPGSQRATGKPT